MITEDYVSFEVAKLLKEKGFDMSCEYLGYNIFDSNHRQDAIENFSCTEAPHLYVPTISQARAMKWLREVHSIHIILDIHWLYFANTLGWMYTINKILENGTEYIDSKGDENDRHFYSTYEEAAEVAIKYCLENLI